MSVNWISTREERHPPINDTGISEDVIIWLPDTEQWLIGYYIKEDKEDGLEPGWRDEWGRKHRVNKWCAVQDAE